MGYTIYLSLGLILSIALYPAYRRIRGAAYRHWLAPIYIVFVTVLWLPLGVWLLVNWRKK